MFNAIAPVLMLDIYNHLTPEDKRYFRTTRQLKFGSTLEEVSAVVCLIISIMNKRNNIIG